MPAAVDISVDFSPDLRVTITCRDSCFSGFLAMAVRLVQSAAATTEAQMRNCFMVFICLIVD